MQEWDFGVACSLPAEFFLAPLRQVLESALRGDDDGEHACGDYQELLLNCRRRALSVPEGLEIEKFPDAVELYEVRKLGDGVGDDVGAIAPLVPSLFSDEFFGAPKEDGLGHDAPVEIFVELVRVLFPLCRCVVAEVDEVLLCALTHHVREKAPSILVLRQVGFRDELLARMPK